MKSIKSIYQITSQFNTPLLRQVITTKDWYNTLSKVFERLCNLKLT